MNLIFEIIKGTPWWAWVSIAYAIYRGTKALKTRVISIAKIFIIPVIFISITGYSVILGKQANMIMFSAWAVPLLIGSIISWFAFQNIKIKVDRKHGLIEVPGTVSTLILIVLIIGVKYYLGYSIAITSDLQQKLIFSVCNLIISGFLSGMFTGKSILLFSKYKNFSQVDLV